MTLKSYTDFVIKFALVVYGITPALATTQEKEQLKTLIESLPSLIGPENWEKLINIFMRKAYFPKEFDKHTYVFIYILWNRDKFTETLAEFCEPLLIKEAAEKPEGGQDAAKA